MSNEAKHHDSLRRGHDVTRNLAACFSCSPVRIVLSWTKLSARVSRPCIIPKINYINITKYNHTDDQAERETKHVRSRDMLS